MDFKRNNRVIEKVSLKEKSVRYGFQKCVFVCQNGWKIKDFQEIALLIIRQLSVRYGHIVYKYTTCCRYTPTTDR